MPKESAWRIKSIWGWSSDADTLFLREPERGLTFRGDGGLLRGGTLGGEAGIRAIRADHGQCGCQQPQNQHAGEHGAELFHFIHLFL